MKMATFELHLQPRAEAGSADVYLKRIVNAVVLVLPFFLWGTNMVIMEEVMTKTGSMFVAFARLGGKKFPSGMTAWLPIALFGLINSTLFQVCLVEGLTRTNAGIGSVIIDSQPLTVAVIAAMFYGEVLGLESITALISGIFGLILIEVPPLKLQQLFHSLLHSFGILKASPPLHSTGKWSLWDSGEWWMLLAAQCMAVGTVMMRWVSRFADPIMVIGWHMVLGSIPVLALSIWRQDPAMTGHLRDLNLGDWAELVYISVFGSALATGLFLYNATKGSLTELSVLTLLTPVFASIFGYLLRNEVITKIELVGSLITLVSICFVKVEKPKPIGPQNLDNIRYDSLPVEATP